MLPLQRSYLEQSAKWQPNSVALRSVDSGETLSYEDLDERANQFSNALSSLGIRQGDRVALALYNTFEFPIAMYGCHKGGFVPVALNYRFATEDFTHAISTVNPSVVVYDTDTREALRPAIEDMRGRIHLVSVGGEDDGAIQFDELLDSALSTTPPEFFRDDEDISYMFFTSGTTGNPKAVAHSVRSGRERTVTSIIANSLSSQSVCLLLLPFFHGGGMDSTLRAVVGVGAELLLVRKPTSEGIPDLIEEYGVTDIRSVPTTLKRVLDDPSCTDRDFSTIECWRATGAVLTESLAKDVIENVTPNLYNAYGSSEGGTNVVLRPEDLPQKAGTVGKAALGNEVRVIAYEPGRDVPPSEEVPVGEEGEVIIRSPQLYHGYFGNAEATNERVRDGWYYTHDIGVIDEDRYLLIKGRTDDMILSGGELVSAVEVEEVLETHDKVSEAIVVGRPDDEWGQVVKAVIAPRNGVEIQNIEDELEAYCRDHPSLARYKRPREYELVEELDHNETGKKLRATYQTA